MTVINAISEMIYAFTSLAFSWLGAFISSASRYASIDKETTQPSVNSDRGQLPPEVWQEIFLFVHQSDDGLSVFDKEDPLYIIGQVCHKWRHLSHHRPRLWSRFLVHGGKVSNLSYGVSHLRTVLERSCSVPLDFTFGCGYELQVDPEIPSQLLSLLIQYSPRWRCAKLMCMTFREALLLGDVRGRIPQLQSVTLDLYLGHISERIYISAFEIGPELSYVDLGGISLDWVLLDPCAKLRYLRIEYYEHEGHSIYSVSDVLRAYPKLTNMTHSCISLFDVITWPALPPPGTPRTIFANITSLSVADGDSINIISLPNLTDLDAGFSRNYFIEGLFPSVVSLLQHSRCRLTFLRLQFAKWDEDSMGMLLSLIPDVETLSISSGQLPGIEDMMSVLTRFLGEKSGDDLRPIYVPRLKTLCIQLSAPVQDRRWWFIDRVFLDMVAMRAERGVLEAVRLFGMRAFVIAFPHSSFDDWERWNDMRRKGLIDVLKFVWN